MSPAMGCTTPNSVISLEIPAVMEHVRLVRLVASGVGAEMGFDIESIDDLRLAVNEACGVLLECSAKPVDADVVRIEFERQDHLLTVRVRRRAAIVAGPPSPVSAAVLDATARHWHLDPRESLVTVSFSDGVAR